MTVKTETGWIEEPNHVISIFYLVVVLFSSGKKGRWQN